MPLIDARRPIETESAAALSAAARLVSVPPLPLPRALALRGRAGRDLPENPKRLFRLEE